MSKIRIHLSAATFALVTGVSGCASTATSASVEDPYEGFNRAMYDFNDRADRAVIEPAARAYRAVTFDELRAGISNALANIQEPVTFSNQLLQGRLLDAGETVGRFMLNSTIGVVGLVDVAGAHGIERQREDFGQTLAVWGVDSGPYLVMPILGPTTPRHLTGNGVDTAFQPLNWAQFTGDDTVLLTRSVLSPLSAREGAIELIEEVREQQLDPYTALRRVYVQNRASAIRNGEKDPDAYSDLPDYDDYYDEEFDDFEDSEN